MNNNQPIALQKWHRVMKNGEIHLLDELLAEDVVFHSPVVWTPQEGKKITKKYLTAAAYVLGGDFKYVREVVNERHFVLEFVCNIEGITVNGIDMIEVNENHQIVDFKVLIRPLQAIKKVHQKMGEMLMKATKK
ncbi:MAG: nuclear transport factor 2 family protein [Chitinophagales bacterium]